jgi:hypothetical protein
MVFFTKGLYQDLGRYYGSIESSAARSSHCMIRQHRTKASHAAQNSFLLVFMCYLLGKNMRKTSLPHALYQDFRGPAAYEAGKFIMGILKSGWKYLYLLINS